MKRIKKSVLIIISIVCVVALSVAGIIAAILHKKGGDGGGATPE